MLKRIQLADIPAETKAFLGIDAAIVYCGILNLLADRNSRSSSLTLGQLMKAARFGQAGTETALSVIHRTGLIEIELQSWDTLNPERSRFLFSLPELDTASN